MVDTRLISASRRAVLAGAAGLAGAALLPSAARAVLAPAGHPLALRAGPARLPLVGAPYPPTTVWAYNGTVPGPELRFRQGDMARIAVTNALAEPTTVHWHGLRVPNAMDGVPHLSQEPVPAGGTFAYEFPLKDAGTFWYHPHANSAEQVARGLAGVLVVEEPEPIRVDRELVWALADWRLAETAAIADDFGHPMDASHAGRLGNTVTVNGAIVDAISVRAGERVRLRLANVSSARVFALEFQGHTPQVIALDGQPVAPHAPADGRVVLAPGQRTDLILDLAGAPGERFDVVDGFYPRQAYRLTTLVYGDEAPVRTSPLDAPVALPANPLPVPDLGSAVRQDVLIEGGAMGALPHGMRMTPEGPFWALNGTAAMGHAIEPLITVKRGQTVRMGFANETAWWHPMHLHGFPFQVLSVDGVPPTHAQWRDTVLLAPRQSAEIAFVAEEPGDWMLHCHVLEHQQSGMMAVVRVA
ncbi:multicopper oxidase family protein [Azospirillum sp. ST 5-10]|uniref:multicopper oxidase family protein n=1 Tax=unclassified Azospirillum TaxID=2630922 RepID=UPI003F4A769A